MTSTVWTHNHRLPDGSRVVRLIGIDPATPGGDRTVYTYLIRRPDGHYRTLSQTIEGSKDDGDIGTGRPSGRGGD